MRERLTTPSGSVGVGLVLVAIGILCVQVGAAIAKSMFDTVGPLGMVTMRLVFSGALLLAVVRPTMRGWNRTTWMWVVTLGLSIAFMNTTFYLAFERIPLGVAVAIELLGPLTIAVIGTRRLLDAVWVVLAAAGIALVGIHAARGALDPVGVLFAVIAGAMWAVYIVASSAVGKHVSGVDGLAVSLGIGGLAVLPLALLPTASAIAAAPWLVGVGLAVAVLSSVIPYGAEMLALRRIPTRVFGILMSLEPAAAALAGFVIIGETLDLIEFGAIALVVLASAGVAATAARRARPEPDGIH